MYAKCIVLALMIAGAAPEKDAGARRALVGAPLPDLAFSGLDGRDMSRASARDRWLVLAFTDARSRDEGVRWFKASAARLAKLAPVSVYNVVTPGGVFLAPRPAIRSRIASDARKLSREARASLAPDLAKRFDEVDVRWHVDFDRAVTARFAAPHHRLSLVLVDPAGTVLRYEDAVDAGTLDRLAKLVEDARAKAAAR